MQLLVLEKRINAPMRRLLMREYIKTPTNKVIETLNECSNSIHADINRVVEDNLVDVVNSVVIDNILLSIKRNQVSFLLRAMSNNHLGEVMECGISHFNTLLNNRSDIPVYDNAEFKVLGAINDYVNNIFNNNREEFNYAVMELLSSLGNLSYLSDRIIRSGFINKDTPVLYVKKDYESR